MVWCPFPAGHGQAVGGAVIAGPVLGLISDLQVLSPGQWAYALLGVLFPMPRKLLEM